MRTHATLGKSIRRRGVVETSAWAGTIPGIILQEVFLEAQFYPDTA